MNRSDANTRTTGRTRLITAAAIAGVALAGAAAIVANVGILSAAQTSDLGTLSAADSLVSAEQQVADATITTTTPGAVVAGTGPAASAQTFVVDDAGTVTVRQGSGGLQLGDVVANPGWVGRLARSDGSTLVVSFTSATRTLELTAAVGPDGALIGEVTQPDAAVPTTPPSSRRGHDDDDDRERDHDETPEYEGRDDDD